MYVLYKGTTNLLQQETATKRKPLCHRTIEVVPRPKPRVNRGPQYWCSTGGDGTPRIRRKMCQLERDFDSEPRLTLPPTSPHASSYRSHGKSPSSPHTPRTPTAFQLMRGEVDEAPMPPVRPEKTSMNRRRIEQYATPATPRSSSDLPSSSRRRASVYN